MATVYKSGKRWRCQIQVQTQAGEVRESRTFEAKAQARDWGYEREQAIKHAHSGKGKTLGDVFDKYTDEVSVLKKGERWERIRLTAFNRDIGHIPLDELNSSHIARWRDARLKSVSAASVRREFALLSSALEVARKEWRWLAVNPVSDVRKPRDSKPRERRYTQDEIDAITSALKLGSDTVNGRTAAAFLFAIETAMRCGEICALTPDDVVGRVAKIRDSKNNTSREVPLSEKALEMWTLYGEGFGLTPMQVSTAFKRGRDVAGVLGATFHDSRREATIRLSKKLDVLELAKVTGHKNISMLLTYYKADAESLADKL